MPLGITSFTNPKRAYGFGGLNIIKITTGVEQTISQSPTRSSPITLADGVIITGSRIDVNNGHTLYYKTISFSNTIPSYGGASTASVSNCGGGTLDNDMVL